MYTNNVPRAFGLNTAPQHHITPTILNYIYMHITVSTAMDLTVLCELAQPSNQCFN